MPLKAQYRKKPGSCESLTFGHGRYAPAPLRLQNSAKKKKCADPHSISSNTHRFSWVLHMIYMMPRHFNGDDEANATAKPQNRQWDMMGPIHEDKILCKCLGCKNENLAYSWRSGRAMVLGSLQCLVVLWFWVSRGRTCGACSRCGMEGLDVCFSLIYPSKLTNCPTILKLLVSLLKIINPCTEMKFFWFDFCFTALQHILGHFGWLP